MKWLWFVPNLVKIYSVFLKLQAVKQSGPGFFGLPCMFLNTDDTGKDVHVVISFCDDLSRKQC